MKIMSEKEFGEIRDMIIDGQEVVRQARVARDSLRNWVKILIGSVLVAISVVSVLIWKVSDNKDRIDFLSKDYAPLWIMQEMQQNNDYMVQEISATFGATEPDKVKIKEIQKKYADFQKWVVNNIAASRGGITTIIRSFEPDSQ